MSSVNDETQSVLSKEAAKNFLAIVQSDKKIERSTQPATEPYTDKPVIKARGSQIRERLTKRI